MLNLNSAVVFASITLGFFWVLFEYPMSFREHVIGGRSALVIGATGATGSKVVAELLQRPEWTRVVVLSRRPLANIEDPKLEPVILDVANDDIDISLLKGIDHFFNCIGTTRSTAGSGQAFVKVEVGITEKVASAAHEAGISAASVISAQGANPKQWGTSFQNFVVFEY